MKRAFTLIELMLVVGIMGLLGTVSVGGYRAMRRGMEESGVKRNAEQFVKNAMQRSRIDRVPTFIRFWNETLQQESDDGTKSLVVVGHAVAIRMAGRVTQKSSDFVIDEFGDLRFMAARDDDGELLNVSEGKSAAEDEKYGTRIYRVWKRNSGYADISSSDNSCMISKSACVVEIDDKIDKETMMTDDEWEYLNDSSEKDIGIAAQNPVLVYGYRMLGSGINWNIGDAYGFEFAELTLPKNYIFGSTFSDSISKPIEEVSNTIRFAPDNDSGSIEVCSLLPNETGKLVANKMGLTISSSSVDSK